MAYYSRAAYTGDGIATDYTVTFPYLDQSHVKIYLDGVITTAWSWVNSTTIRFTSAPALNAEIMLLRRSSPSVRLVDYTGGAAFDEATLDQDSTQAFYLFQEAIDQANTGFSYDPFGDNFAAVLTGTSVSSLTIGTGSQNLVTQFGKNWSVGQRLRISDDNGANLMEGEVTSYAGTSLQVNVDYTEGAGTLADWNISVAGARGASGSSGAAVTGPQGPAGTNGHTILSGTVAPTNTDGSNGDIYIKTDTSTLYGPKAGGTWPAGVSLIGATGSAGAAGANGSTWYSGSGAPAGGTGVNGDYYFRTDTGQVYSKSAGAWSAIANLTGPTGSTGSAGSTGPAGADGVATGYKLTFDTATADADPGQGKVRANNGTFASITKLFIDNLDANATDITTWLDSLDDSSNTIRGTIRLQKATDPTVFMEFNVTGSVVDGTGYRKVNVTPLTGAIPSNATSLAATFLRAGDVGAAGAGTGDVTTSGAVTSGHIAKFNDASGDVLADGGALGALAAKNTVATADIDNNAVDDAKLRQGAGNTVIGRSSNAAGNNADIQATTDGHVLRLSGTTLGFGTVATAGLADDAITDAKLRNSAANSVIGRSTNSTGDPADIAGTDGQVLRVSGTTLGFGTIATAGIANDAVDNTKAANMAQSTIKGRAVGAGTGDPTDLTATQATAILDAVVGDSGSGGTKGLAPAPAAGDAAAGKFLKSDGTWAVPSGGGTAATQADQETATSTTTFVSPGRQQFHPSASKFWIKSIVTTGTPANTVSYNVTSITDTGTGRLTVTIATDFSSANWCFGSNVEADSTTLSQTQGLISFIRSGGQAAGTVEVDCADIQTPALRDPSAWHAFGFGDQ